MVSDFPAGLDRSGLDYIMRHNNDVVELERIEGPAALWKVTVSVEGGAPVQLLADNGINDIYFQVFVQIDTDHLAEALRAVQPYATVGVVVMNDSLFLRSSFYMDFSNVHAVSNTLRAVALAWTAYQQVVAEAA
ncbi:hypothetical protein SK571_26580 [Lentzea sp. BCCO 10_0798]|uniref:Sensory transduction regulator n=1 Tax=Lentzea kristufekii TaxID=3095430 RepID=A0ABU4TXB6_9PSEU|nr:hypothetical protein [Lentzea sp. BCCO 10_0798]MDX8052958.1 hypothetical protein [Lentzea sp. BCCO 10_0798]